MSYKLEINKISKEKFLNINEKDVMLITNPGRIGDEDGVTFIIKQNNGYKAYRIEGWMYNSIDYNKDDYISLEDTQKQFPKWYKTWKNNYKGKYKYLYMGFGNGLSIDNSIYNKYKPYLDKKVKEYSETKTNEENIKYVAIYNVWKEAFLNMINNR